MRVHKGEKSRVRDDRDDPKGRDNFDREIKRKNLIGYWMIPARSEGFREPEPNYGPYLWKWNEIERMLYRSVEYIPREEAYRRFIGFQHPQVPLGTTPNLILGGQLIRAGESAPAHRHTMDAVRFVVSGEACACTVVEGEAFPMNRGDLVTTPNWNWHDHVNEGDRDTIWLDGAVAPLIGHFQIGFAEPYAQARQPVSRPRDWSRHQHGALKPKALKGAGNVRRPPYRYAWEDTQAALTARAQEPGDPFDGVLLHFADPVTGGPTVPTMACEIQLLRAGEKGRSHRHTHAVIYHVFQGRGRSAVGQEVFDWEEGDTFVVPLWTWHAHENNASADAILFSLNDRPVLEALGFEREEAAPSP